MKALIEKMIQEEIRTEVRNVVKSYFAPFIELEKGPVVQVHAAVTRKGLTKAVRRTKVSQLADMEVGKEYFFKTPKGVDVRTWTNRWSSSADYLQKKTGFKWSTHRDREQGGALVTRTR